MSTLTFTFHGPDGQTVAAVDGRVIVNVADHGLEADLEDAAALHWPVTPTGPWWLGGGGITDPASVFWAARMVLPHWFLTGDTPPVPTIPDPEPGVDY